MLGKVLACSRAAALCAVLAGVVAGCAAPASSNVSTPGKALTIYTSVPPGAADQRAQDVLDAEELALKQAGGRVGGFTVTLRALQGKKITDDARTAINDPTAIAYLGDAVPGQSADSIGITNAVDLAQLSPTDTAQALTQAVPEVPASPKHYYEDYGTYGHTFARLVPTTATEAAALVQEMRALHVKVLYLTDDGSDYGAVLAAAVRRLAPPIVVRSAQTGADAVLDATASQSAAARVFDAAAAGNPAIKLFAPSALNDQAFVSMLSPSAQRSLYVSAPGFLTGQLNLAGKGFISQFEAHYQHAPAPEAIFGYEAMSAMLAALSQAGSAANSRATVVHDLLALDRSSSVLGPYRLRASGDTTLTGPFLISRVRAGRLVPFTSAG